MISVRAISYQMGRNNHTNYRALSDAIRRYALKQYVVLELFGCICAMAPSRTGKINHRVLVAEIYCKTQAGPGPSIDFWVRRGFPKWFDFHWGLPGSFKALLPSPRLKT